MNADNIVYFTTQLLFFIFGLVFGSFVNVCIYRMPLHQSIVFGRSHCTNCNKPIAYFDLIPVISYVILLGKCRLCKTKISPFYPFIELLTGVLFVMCLYRFTNITEAAFMCLVCCSFIAIFFIDLRHYIIPDSLNIAIIVLSIIAMFVMQKSIVDSIAGAFAISIPLFIIVKVTKGFGEGDVFLFFACGLLLGMKLIALAAFISIISGGAVAVILLICKKKGLKSQMPFGPFIVYGVLTSLFFGKEILSWYGGLFYLYL